MRKRFFSFLPLFTLVGVGLILWSFITPFAAEPPLRSFSMTTETFPEELKRFLLEGRKAKKEDDKQFEEFELIWTSPRVTKEEQLEVIELSNQMLRVTMRNKKYFEHWKNILEHYLKDSIRSPEYRTLLNLLEKAVTHPGMSSTAQHHFLSNTWKFLREGLLHETLAFGWYARNGSAQIEYEPELQYRFSEVDIVCTNAKDSIVIRKTHGTYYPFTQEWVGNGGRVDWTRSGYATDEVFAELNNYTVDMTRSQYTADSALMTNKHFLERPILGTLNDRIAESSDTAAVRFPVHTTYEKRVRLKNMIEGVEFEGGCMMEGSRLVGLGTQKEPLLFRMARNGKPFLFAKAEQLAFTPDAVASDFAEITIHMGADSLYHSGLRFEYNEKAEMLRIRPTELLITRAPILSSYHNMSIHFDEITWQKGGDTLVLGPRIGATTAKALFQSANYFVQEEFDIRMGLDNQHPIFALNNYAIQVKNRTFPIADFASYIRHNVTDVRQMLMRLAVEGLLLYNVGAQTVTLLPALVNQVMARLGRIDYDVIRFTSSVGAGRANATLDLNNNEMDVYSVSHITVSDSQNVNITPSGRYVRLGKNRSFAFDGEVEVGLFTFTGEELVFNYENYTIDLKEIDMAAMEFQLNAYDMYGKRQLARVLSQLRNLTGMVHIDKPNNKSGLIKNPEYPIFESTKPSFVYYDAPSIHGGVYEKENFYFEVDPFIFKNMNNFEMEDLVFGGKFYSDDIFAPFNDSLRLQPDLSLGFVHPTPPEGMALYQGKGQFYNNIHLSNAGLQGDGKLVYITSTTTSSAFGFFPDSTSAVSNTFTMEPRGHGVHFPDIQAYKHRILWRPRKDVFFAYRGEKPFSMYRKEADFKGDLTLQPVGLTGKGELDMTKAFMTAQHFQFSDRSWHADTLTVQFFVPNEQIRAFSSNFLAGEVNYDKREGEFWRIGEAIVGTLDILKYGCFAHLFGWHIDKDFLTFKTPMPLASVTDRAFCPPRMLDRDTVPPGTIYHSIVPEEDSLYFMSPHSTYYMRSPRLKSDSVAYVLVADAIAFPDKGIVQIEPQARMLPLRNARLEANVFDRFHHIYDATLSISSRARYAGKGRINYLDARDSIEVIELDSIYITERHQGNATQAYGFIPAHQKFKLSPRFGYEGRVQVDANEPLYYFNGGARPLYNCTGMVAERLAFKSRLNPDSLYIPVSHPAKDLNDVGLASGTVIAYDSTHVYPAFMTQRRNYLDGLMSQPVGFMTYDEKRGRFIVADSLLFTQPDSVQQRIEFASNDCRIFTEGRINLPYDLGRVRTHSTGRIIHDLQDSTQIIRLFTDFNFHFSPDALLFFANSLAGRGNLTDLDLTQDIYKMGLRERVSPPQYARLTQQIELFGITKEPIPELNATISFTDLQLRWDQENRSLVSVGRLGVGTIGGMPIYKRINGYIELFKRVSGDWFVIYLEPAPGEYYVFTFTGITMYANSSNQEYLKIINKTARGKRRLKEDGPLRKYVYQVGSTTETYNAQKRYKQLQTAQ